MSSLFPRPQRLLSVMAHPDDAEFYAGGWLAQIIAAGTEVHFLLLTDGQGGAMDPNLERDTIGVTRRSEQEFAATILGVQSVTFLGEQDGQLFDSWPLRLAVARHIRALRPDTLLTTDPQHFYDEFGLAHPDHRAAGAVALAAAMPVANVHAVAPELADLAPHTVSRVILAATSTPNRFAALETSDFAKKLAALVAHRSQTGQPKFESFMRARAEQTAKQARTLKISAELAEAFVDLKLH